MSAAERTNDSAMKSRAELGREREVGDVLLGDRGQLRPGVGDVDALARRQRAGGDGAGDDVLPVDALDGEARHAVADHDLRALGDERGELVELDHHVVGRRAGARGHERDRVADRDRPRHGRAGQPQLRPLKVEQQPDRAPGALARGADLGRTAAEVVVVAVRAVQPRAVQPGGDEPIEHALGVGGGPERGHDLRTALQHGPECCIEPLARAVRRCRWGVDEPIGR